METIMQKAVIRFDEVVLRLKGEQVQTIKLKNRPTVLIEGDSITITVGTEVKLIES
jgi:hypothetical protein